MRLKTVLSKVAPDLAEAGFKRQGDVFYRITGGDVLGLRFQATPVGMAGRSDFMVRSAAATANWIRFMQRTWAQFRQGADLVELAVLWKYNVKRPPGVAGIGDVIWTVTPEHADAALEVLSRLLVTVVIPGMEAELTHHRRIEEAIRAGDEETALRLIAQPVVALPGSWSQWYGGLHNAQGFAAWLQEQ
ncbi:DUF4304 domain-containing protein [Dactylosporangium sp. NPDC051541]|uniref:DUF4304 domain-containing protein n=1 Tax=Dactylosporangium sp. NPDC051541 TaxID=3363977 RepID=UPI00379CEED4